MNARATEARPLIGVTMGDPLGIGPEVIVKALSEPELRAQARFVVYGLHDVLELAADAAEIHPYWWREPFDHGPRVGSGVLVADFDDLSLPRINGRREPDELAGAASLRFLDEAISHLREGRIDGLVTGPICKESWAACRVRFKGHTDLLAHRLNARRIAMAFFAGDLRVALASAHVPLFELRNHFSIGLVSTPIDLMHDALRDWFDIPAPRIGVLGLNPHAGESGLLGDEEQRVIEPALAIARNNGVNVEGPLPPDTAFTEASRKRFDGLVAMYHDQGLIPVKLLAFDEAVNVTLGLGAIRTSPDHGTAFDIAGKNRANPGSMRAALQLAIDLARQRTLAATPTQCATVDVPPSEHSL